MTERTIHITEEAYQAVKALCGDRQLFISAWASGALIREVAEARGTTIAEVTRRAQGDSEIAAAPDGDPWSRPPFWERGE